MEVFLKTLVLATLVFNVSAEKNKSSDPFGDSVYLTSSTFDQMVANKPHFVMFFKAEYVITNVLKSLQLLIFRTKNVLYFYFYTLDVHNVTI